MAISPNKEEALAIEIRRIYEDAELRLLQMIAKRLVSGSGDVAEWQTEKLNQLADLLAEARKTTNGLNRTVPKEILKIINLAYVSGNESAIGDLQKALEKIQAEDQPVPESIQTALLLGSIQAANINIAATMETFAGVNRSAVQALAAATTRSLTERHVPIVRAVEDIYRRVMTEVGGSPLTGVETRREATQRALDQFAKTGIKTFTDKGGKRWDLATYAEMTTRTMIGQASLQGHIDKMVQMGFDLAQVSDHKEECPLCRPWEGKILSVSGNTTGRSTLAEARAAGLFHTYCGHRLNTYFEGLTEPLGKTEDPSGYEERQKQRYIERQIRDWKKRQAVAVTEDAKKRTDAKVAEWNNHMKEFIAETGRRRKREREQIHRAR